MKLVKQALFTALAALAISACDGDGAILTGVDGVSVATDDSNSAATGNIVQTAVDAGSFTTLAAALGATGLDEVLADETREFTVFAPTDEAFAALGTDTINALMADPEQLSDILLYHVLADQNVDSATAISLAGNSVDAANEDPLQLSFSDGNLFVNTAQVITADVAATNGTIHVIDEVLLPPTGVDQSEEEEQNNGVEEPIQASNIVETALAAGTFNTLAAALEATELVSVLADENATFTVFAPTDDAFDVLGQDTIDALLADPETLRDILLYHVVAGQVVDASTAIGLAGSSVEMANGDSTALSLDAGRLLVNSSVVTATDINASNGIIHVIDAVLMPPADETEPQPEEQPLMSIYDTAIAAANFQTLATALQVTGLDGPLAGGHETYTVFAPTDDAFALLGSDTINALVADPETLKNILLYHLIDGAVDADTAISLAGSQVHMANGDPASLSLRGGELFINDAQVIMTDIQATNGVIHVIDSVLMPH